MGHGTGIFSSWFCAINSVVINSIVINSFVINSFVAQQLESISFAKALCLAVVL